MKKILLIAAMAFIGFTSCKKDYNCTCDILGQVTVIPLENTSKDDAQSACDAENLAASLVGGSCTLD